MFNYCLSAEAVATGWTLCLQNAGGLVRAAERLLQADHVPPALSLAILAQEELGKALLVADAAVLSADNDHGWRNFQGRFRSHETKQEVYGRLFIRRSIVLFLRAWLRNIPITEVRVEVPPDSIKFHYDMYRFSESAIKLKLDSRLAQFD